MIISIFFIIKPCISGEIFEITHPTDKSLLGAGHFDIKWTSISAAKNYQLYINEELITTTTSTNHDYYTTKVQKHSVYISAELTHGEKLKTKTVEFFVTKKGLAVNSEMGKNLNPLTMNIGWYYSWSPTSPFLYTNKKYDYSEFVPMIWGVENEDNHLKTVKEGDFMYLLGYNEPDLADQCNIPYLTAVENWPKFEGKSRYLGSPVPALSPTWKDCVWLKNFMGGVDTNTVDFIALHCYYSQYGGKEAAKTFLDDVVDGNYKLFNKPIWITEFAISGWGYSNVEKRKEVEEFMRACIDGLNERDYVERFAWFSFNTDNENDGASAMWTESTGELTALGETYVNYGNPEGYDYRNVKQPEIDITSYVRDELPFDDFISFGEKKYQNLLRNNEIKASASSSSNDAIPEFAIDNDMKTRWESSWSDPQLFTVDLSNTYYVKQIEVVWQYASASVYSIETSIDGESFTEIAKAKSLSLIEHRCETFKFNKMVQCRYVRIKCLRRTTEWGYSIWEMAVYGSDQPDFTEEPKLTDEQVLPNETSVSEKPKNDENE